MYVVGEPEEGGTMSLPIDAAAQIVRVNRYALAAAPFAAAVVGTYLNALERCDVPCDHARCLVVGELLGELEQGGTL